MNQTPTPSMSGEERLQLVRWLIDSYDQRKASVASRAAILLSADALLLTAATFLFDTLLSAAADYDPVERGLLVAGGALTLLLLLASIAVATSGMANIWRTHAQRQTKAPSRLYFYPRKTFEKFPTFEDFAEDFRSVSNERFEKEALGHLWIIIKEYGDRYKRLRLAIRLLVVGIVPFVPAQTGPGRRAVHRTAGAMRGQREIRLF